MFKHTFQQEETARLPFLICLYILKRTASFISQYHIFCIIFVYLHMLARLDQLPHEVLQLAVPLDQIAEVGIQHLLRKNNSNIRKEAL